MAESHHNSDDFAKASEYLRLTLGFFSQHKISPTPANYQMGYECVAGRNEALKRGLDDLFSQPEAPSDEQLQQIHHRFFIQDEKSLETMRNELRRIITSLQGEFERSGGKFNEYAHILSRFANTLNGSVPAEKLSEETDKIIDETHSMENTQHKLEIQMSKVLSEVDLLRKELEQVKEESLIDALTGISNRKAFDAALDHTINSARERNASFTVLLGDIDRFKNFNDTYGHLVGDKVLRFVAATLKRCVKGKDMAARFGGEEFAVILPQTDQNGAYTVAEQIRKEVSSGKLKDKASGGAYGRITISIGVAQFYASDLSNDLIRRADRALYLAKERGRNRVEKAS